MKLTRCQFLELGALLVTGCGSSEDEERGEGGVPATDDGGAPADGDAGGEGVGGDGGTDAGGRGPMGSGGSAGAEPLEGGSSGCSSAADPRPVSTCEPPPASGSGGGSNRPEVPDSGVGGSESGGASSQGGDAGNPDAQTPVDAGSNSAECAGRAEADDFFGSEMVSMDALFDNHDQPHEFVLSRAQLDEALALEYMDETGAPIYLRFDTTSGSGPARGLDPTGPHVHPVLFGRAHAEELLAQGSVETVNAPAADEGGVVHRHMLIVRLC